MRLPSTYGFREFCDAGGLLCCGSNLQVQFGRFRYFIDKILKGTKAGDVPIEEPTVRQLPRARLGAWQKRRNGAEAMRCPSSSSVAVIGTVKYLGSRPG
jgi:hypothetical protein